MLFTFITKNETLANAIEALMIRQGLEGDCQDKPNFNLHGTIYIISGIDGQDISNDIIAESRAAQLIGMMLKKAGFRGTVNTTAPGCYEINHAI